MNDTARREMRRELQRLAIVGLLFVLTVLSMGYVILRSLVGA